MQVESLHDRRGDDRVAADIVHKLHRIFDSFLAAYTISRTTKGNIERQIFEETHNAGTLVDADTRQLSNANARIRERCDLRARQKVKAVFVVILIDENLRGFFRRDSLLNVVREHLPESQV